MMLGDNLVKSLAFILDKPLTNAVYTLGYTEEGCFMRTRERTNCVCIYVQRSSLNLFVVC